jgi:hypothetical protein
MLDYTLDDLFDSSSPASLRVPTFGAPGAQNAFLSALDPATIAAGELQGNTTVQDGYLQSANYVPNATGWRLSPEGADINGGVSVDSINVPDTTTANSFHVDSDGNAWWGAAALADAIASIAKTGEAIFKNYSLLSQFTAGENLTKGKLACLLNTVATWGNRANSSTNKSTTAILSAFTYVDSSTPNTATGSAPNLVRLGTSVGTNFIYGKLDLTSSNPGLPAWNEIETVKLRLYVVFTASGTTSAVTLSRLTASFTESTVTWNTKPTDDGITWATAAIATPTSNGEPCASTADTLNNGYIEFDITELYRLWSQGTLPNNGFVIKGGGDSALASLGGTTRTDSSAFNQAPFVVSIINRDSPGQGTSFVACDGKAYIAKHSDYQRIKNILGIVGDTVSSGATAPIYALADKSIIPSSVLTVVNGRVYYLSDDAGTLSVLTNDIIESNFYDRRIGVGTPQGLSIDLDKSPLFIKSAFIPSSGLLPPSNARYAVIVFTSVIGGVTYGGTLRLEKSFLQSDSITVSSGGSATSVSASWASGTSGLLTVGNTTTATVYWYR